MYTLPGSRTPVIKMSTTPEDDKAPPQPWYTFNADFCGPFPNGEKLLVVIDSYCRYPEVEIMQSTTTTAVISTFQRIFARHGYPEELTTDNGSRVYRISSRTRGSPPPYYTLLAPSQRRSRAICKNGNQSNLHGPLGRKKMAKRVRYVSP